MIGVMFAGLAGILIAPVANMTILPLIELVIFGYAAAVVGRLRSLPLTFLGAMILGIAQLHGRRLRPPTRRRRPMPRPLPMVLLFIVLLLIPEVRLTHRPGGPGPATQGGQRPQHHVVGGGVVVVASSSSPTVLTGNDLLTLGTALTLSLLALSLTPLSGYGGQISLCQYTFLGLGALSMHWVDGGGSVLGRAGRRRAVRRPWGPSWPCPSLRLRGIYLALATLAFAVVMDDWSSSPRPRSWAIGGRRRSAGPTSSACTSSPTAPSTSSSPWSWPCASIGVGALRRGPFGRRLVGMNDSPAACSTVGLSLTVTKLAVFALSAGTGRPGRRPLRRSADHRRRRPVPVPLQHRCSSPVSPWAGRACSPGPSPAGSSSPSSPSSARTFRRSRLHPAPDRRRHRGHRAQPQRYRHALREWPTT